MSSIWLGTRSAIVAGCLLFGAEGIARADAAPSPAVDLAVANSDDSCGGDLSSCENAVRNLTPPLSSHLQKKPVHHRVANRGPGVIAARQRPGPDQVAFQPLICTGASAWSLLCPGAQVIGISY
jgi:hypothetical protein